MMDMDMSWMGPWMMVGLLVLIVLVGSVGFLAVRAARGGRMTLDSPRELLERRLAAGELDTDEYYERESALRSSEPDGRRRRRRRGA